MVQVDVDRKKAGTVYVTPNDVAKSLAEATSSSRFTVPNFWADPKTGIGYQVQVEVPRPVVRSPKGIKPIGSIDDLKMVPVKQNAAGQVLVRDVATVSTGTMPGEIDRYNMKRQVSMTANFAGTDLGSVSRQVAAALQRLPEPPRGVKVEVRGQIPPMHDMLSGLAIGLGLAIVVIFLLLSANFQSLRLSLVTVSTAPAVIAGVVVMLYLTGTTLNIQSLHRRDHGRRRGDGQRDSAGDFCREPSAAGRCDAGCRGGRRRGPLASHPDDDLRHDGGHAAHGAGLG